MTEPPAGNPGNPDLPRTVVLRAVSKPSGAANAIFPTTESCASPPRAFENPTPRKYPLLRSRPGAVSGQACHTSRRGRDAGCSAPPAQIPACALTHEAPTSGV